ncbi:MAG: sensor histidine kinase, partial [Spirochaetales bacterium]|nr:sensor histidine kinase [Spirochaetales bacterium]
GPGISKSDIPFIWDRLYRSPMVKNIPGTGLGLSLVKAIVMAHKGSVEIETSKNNGSSFKIHFSKSFITKL